MALSLWQLPGTVPRSCHHHDLSWLQGGSVEIACGQAAPAPSLGSGQALPEQMIFSK